MITRIPGNFSRSSPICSVMKVSGFFVNPAPTPIQRREGPAPAVRRRPRSRPGSAGRGRSRRPRARPRRHPLANSASVSSPWPGMVVGPDRGVAGLLAGGGQGRRPRPEVRRQLRKRASVRDGSTFSLLRGLAPLVSFTTFAVGGDSTYFTSPTRSNWATHSMCGVWGNINRPHPGQPITGLDQLGGVRGQRGRTAQRCKRSGGLRIRSGGARSWPRARPGADRSSPHRAGPASSIRGASRCGRWRRRNGRWLCRLPSRSASRSRSPRELFPGPRPDRPAGPC